MTKVDIIKILKTNMNGYIHNTKVMGRSHREYAEIQEILDYALSNGYIRRDSDSSVYELIACGYRLMDEEGQ